MTEKLQELRDVLSLFPEDRLKIVKKSDNPKALIQAMPEEEVWLTIKKIGEENALSIIEGTSTEQLQYILDIELWKRDKWRVDNGFKWLTLLKECGEEKVLQWIYETDPEMVILTLREFVCVKKKDSPDDDPLEREWPGSITPSTLDGVYYFQCLSRETDEIVRPIFNLVGRDNYEFFVKLCESIITELASSLTESALTWRAKRLAEKGFVSLTEALEVYKYLSERQISQLPKRKGLSLDEHLLPPHYPLAISGESYPMLMFAIASLKGGQWAQEISCELAKLANKVLVADSRPVTPETVADALRKVMGYTNIGLEYLSGADVHNAGRVLRERWVVHLFQIGFSAVAKLRQRAQKFIKLGWPAKVDGDLSLLGEALASRINAVIRKRPLYFGSEEGAYREFKSLDEIRKLETDIGLAEYIGGMFKEVFKLPPKEIKPVSLWSTALLTVWARGVLTGHHKFLPLTTKELSTLLKKVWGKTDFKAELQARFLEWLIKRQPNISLEEKRHCSQFIEGCFDLFEEEFSELRNTREIDSRFVTGIWVVAGSGLVL